MKTKRPPLLAVRFLAALFLAALPGLAVTPSLLGPGFQVNATSAGSQDLADVAGLRGSLGGFVAVWADQSAIYQLSVKARLFLQSGQPAGGDITLVSSGTEPRVAALPGGGFAVVWSDFSFAVHLRTFNAQGLPASAVVDLDPLGAEPDVATDGAGNIAVVWRREGKRTQVQRFAADGHSLGAATALSDGPFDILPRVAANVSGDLLVSWTDSDLDVKARRYDAGTGDWSPAATLVSVSESFHHASAPVIYPAGNGAVLLNEDLQLFAVRLNAAGSPVGTVVHVADDVDAGDKPEVAVDSLGNALVTWTSNSGFLRDGEVHARLFDAAWQPLGEEFPLRRDPFLSDGRPAVAALAQDAFAVVWTNGDIYWAQIPVTPPPPADGEDGDQFGVFGQVLGPARCGAGSEVLCLGVNGRFEARVTWKTPSGQTGTGRARPLSADTGALWFFNGGNLELMVKVLDGRQINGHFWVFYGSLSNLEYTLTVKDTVTGTVKTFRNAQRQLASQADVRAFPNAPEPPVVVPVLPPLLPPASTGPLLSLAHDRFRIEVELTDPRTNTVGQGQAVPLTNDTGAFWFFDRSNLELMIKVLDGRSFNGHFWVFFGALSDVDYTITVTDTVTGEHRTYHNDRHTLASRADIDAF